ncbi:MAG: magnesium transporter CorA family protein [Candidatus Diapherotrites archaeon]|nr:magnesium transporter CorA family protein [Candidatus Diapherotrites archaeon]
MIDVFSLTSKEVTNVSLEKLSSRHDSVVFAESPSKEEIDLLSGSLNISKDDILEASGKYTRPKVDENDETTYFLFAAAGEVNSTKPVSVGVFLQKKLLLVVSKEKIHLVSKVKDSLEKNKYEKEWKSEGLSFFVFRFLDGFVESFFPAIERIDDEIEVVEKKVLHSPSKSIVEKIFALKKKLIFLHKAFVANREVLMSIEKGYVSVLNKKTVLRFKDTYYDINQLIDIEETYRDIVTSAFDIYLSMVSNDMNVVMKKITVIGAILLVPTLISGIYGMNFDFIPFDRHPLGFYMTVFGMALIFVVMYYYSRVKNWI